MNMMAVIVNEGTGIDLGLDHSLGTGKGTLRLSFSLISCAHICNIAACQAKVFTDVSAYGLHIFSSGNARTAEFSS
jgi:hypothetical protein